MAVAAKPAGKKPPKKAADKPAAKTTEAQATTGAKTEAKTEGKKLDGLQKPLTPSPELAVIVGKDMLPRGQVVSKMWEYIRKHNLQNPADKREILADENLKKVFGVDKCTMFEMNKYLKPHLK